MSLFMFLQDTLILIAVILIDVTLAANNAVVISMSAQGLTEKQRRSAIIYGTGFSALLRIGMTLIASHILDIVGLTFFGGILLLWVCWKSLPNSLNRHPAESPERSTYVGEAIIKIIIADIAMSFDNVIAVGGAATSHPIIILLGLIASVILTVTASLIAVRLLKRFRWLAWSGLILIFAVSLRLIIQGGYNAWLFFAH
ncbi:YjbE family putative metal transport protein [Saccharibacter sp. 17.LH.SD]|uniref:YjbE family putative metal transport protein n=1 Tax=Saccharibacter sp. 17.LH.SD TaxID=2689393 RepID=UPI00192678FE|nr:YjbE family putative metal transport protein [Saccharibacter sp. 17.LH.SD]